MHTYSLDEIKKEIKAQGYKHIGLFDEQNKTIIAFNNSKVKPEDRLKEICTRLTSKTLPDGNYQVKGKNAVQQHVSADIYWYQKGDAEPISPIIRTAPVQQPIADQPPLLTYAEALRLNTEINRLELENASLLDEIEGLNERISDLESKEPTKLGDGEPEEPGFMGSAGKFLQDTLMQAAPFIDKILEQRDRKLTLMERRLERRPAPEPPAQQKPDPARAFIEWYDSNYNDPHVSKDEIMPGLVDVYNSATDLDNFEATLRAHNPDIYAQFSMFKNFYR